MINKDEMAKAISTIRKAIIKHGYMFAVDDLGVVSLRDASGKRMMFDRKEITYRLAHPEDVQTLSGFFNATVTEDDDGQWTAEIPEVIQCRMIKADSEAELLCLVSDCLSAALESMAWKGIELPEAGQTYEGTRTPIPYTIEMPGELY